MKFDSVIEGLVMPSDVNFYYATNSGNVFAQYKDEDGENVFSQVGGSRFAADLLAANANATRSVTSSDIHNIIAKVYAEALRRASNVAIAKPCYLAKSKTSCAKTKATGKKSA